MGARHRTVILNICEWRHCWQGDHAWTIRLIRVAARSAALTQPSYGPRCWTLLTLFRPLAYAPMSLLGMWACGHMGIPGYTCSERGSRNYPPISDSQGGSILDPAESPTTHTRWAGSCAKSTQTDGIPSCWANVNSSRDSTEPRLTTSKSADYLHILGYDFNVSLFPTEHYGYTTPGINGPDPVKATGMSSERGIMTIPD